MEGSLEKQSQSLAIEEIERIKAIAIAAGPYGSEIKGIKPGNLKDYRYRFDRYLHLRWVIAQVTKKSLDTGEEPREMCEEERYHIGWLSKDRPRQLIPKSLGRNGHRENLIAFHYEMANATHLEAAERKIYDFLKDGDDECSAILQYAFEYNHHFSDETWRHYHIHFSFQPMRNGEKEGDPIGGLVVNHSERELDPDYRAVNRWGEEIDEPFRFVPFPKGYDSEDACTCSCSNCTCSCHKH